MYKRPFHIHVMDIKPEFRISYDNSYFNNKPIMLSYEGGNHYNSLVPHDHCTIQSRPGVAEMMTLSATIIENVRMMKIAKPKKVTSEELNIILEKKIK